MIELSIRWMVMVIGMSVFLMTVGIVFAAVLTYLGIG